MRELSSHLSHRRRLECLPLGDTSQSASLLHVLLPEQVLAFVAGSVEFQQSDAALLSSRLEQSVLPHCAPLRTVPHSATLADALAIISESRLHALPLVDHGRAPPPQRRVGGAWWVGAVRVHTTYFPTLLSQGRVARRALVS